ncbi:MAG: hypothetical protein ABI140_04775 [Jatrophihabitantaceae bacterium]
MGIPDSDVDLIDAALAAQQYAERLEEQHVLAQEQRIDQRLTELLATQGQSSGV